MPTMRSVLALLCASLWLATTTPGVAAMPYVFLVNGGNKCVKVDVTRDQVVLVNYHAPDLQEVDEKKAGQRRMPGRDGDEDDDDQEDIAGMDRDTMFNRASGRRHNKRTNVMPDMLINMNHLVADNSGRRRAVGTSNKAGTRKLREDLTEADGKLVFLTGSQDGYVEVCMQAYTATKAAPRRMGLRITTLPAAEYEQQQMKEKAKAQKEVVLPKEIANEMLLKVETSRITTELERFTKRIQDIGNGASQSKDRESSFHQVSVKLSRAIRRWPIFRICILLIAGYMQVSHVVKYMKSRHIY